LFFLAQVTFDSTAIRYEDLLTVFWDIIDPTNPNGQGNDIGSQYRSGIYYHDDHQQRLAIRLVLLALACVTV
jgi:peptide-methionine (S)-S-oxide reductase